MGKKIKLYIRKKENKEKESLKTQKIKEYAFPLDWYDYKHKDAYPTGKEYTFREFAEAMEAYGVFDEDLHNILIPTLIEAADMWDEWDSSDYIERHCIVPMKACEKLGIEWLKEDNEKEEIVPDSNLIN